MTNAAIAEPAEPHAPIEAPFDWERFASYPNHWAALIVAGLLESEGVLTHVASDSAFPAAINHPIIFVPKPLVHRARWILAIQPPTEAELIFLATGELDA